MNAAIAWNTFHRILTRPMVLVLLSFHSVFGLFYFSLAKVASFDQGLLTARHGLWLAYTWMLGAGLIGKDVSDGILPLIFSRPVSRAEYVLSRWAGLVGSVAAVMLLDLSLGMIVSAKWVGPVELNVLLANYAISFWLVGASAALLALFSTLVPSNGDIGIFAGAWILLWLISMNVGDPATAKLIAKSFAYILIPGFGAFEHAKDGFPIFHLAAAGLQGSIYLGLALALMRRKEITYVMAS